MIQTQKQCSPFKKIENHEEDSIGTFNGIVKEFMVKTIDMVRHNIHEEDDIIDRMLQLLQKKMTKINFKKSQTSFDLRKQNSNQIQALQKVEAAVQQLNKDSDLLSQRLFDLSQTLIQKRLLESEQQKKKIQQACQNKVIRLKIQYENQKVAMQSQLKQYKQKCHILQECLDARQEFIKKELERQDQMRRHELFKYLQTIDQIYSEIQNLKNVNNLQSSIESEQILESQNSPRAYPDNYSEQYYNLKKDDRSTHVGSRQHRLRNPSYYNSAEYQTEADRRTCQSREQMEIDRIQSARKSNSKSKAVQIRYIHVPSPRYNHYFHTETDRRERSRSSDKEKKTKRDSVCKNGPIILHFKSPQQSQRKICQTKESEIFAKRSLWCDNQNEFKLIEEKNMRMQRVQQKLHDLKKKLEREFKPLKR